MQSGQWYSFSRCQLCCYPSAMPLLPLCCQHGMHPETNIKHRHHMFNQLKGWIDEHVLTDAKITQLLCARSVSNAFRKDPGFVGGALRGGSSLDPNLLLWLAHPDPDPATLH